AVFPANQTLSAGRSYQFNADVMGTHEPDGAVTWRVSSNNSGTGVVTPGTTINANGMLFISANETLPTLFVVATSVFDPTKSAFTAVNVVMPTVTSVTVSPLNQSIIPGNTLQFTAIVTGTNDPDPTVTWKVSSNAAGSGAVSAGTEINNNGLLTVSVNETLPTLFIIATSVFDPTKSGNTVINVIVPTVLSVTVSPVNQTITAGNTLQFTAAVAGLNDPDTAVIWRVSSNAAGSGAVASGTVINDNGLLTVSANETARTLFIFATSVFDTSKSGSVLLSVNPAPTSQLPTPTPTPTPIPAPMPTVTDVTINPSSFETRTNTNVQFSASVVGTNNPNTSVTWRVGSNASGTGAMAPTTTINSNGRLTIAPNEWNTHLYVFAASAADPSKVVMAVVRVINNNENQGPNQGS
ncbi:MAG: Ig-like domain-containing protein, partial [Treponema sp.]|nr:Ig-like domain-containing protein [Treponema sp.]